MQAFLVLCLAYAGQINASDDCNEALASSIWTAAEQRLEDLFGVNVSRPPKFVIYPTSNDLPDKIGETVLGFYDSDAKEISVACLDNDTSVFALNVRHESTHYYLDMAYGKVPDWLEEGLAAYMEEGSLNDSVPRDHLNKARLDEFIYLLRKAKVPPLTSIFSGRGFAKASQYYSASWALVFSLLHHDDPDIQKKRRSQVQRLLQIIKAGENNPEVINQKFIAFVLEEGNNLPNWQIKWHRQMWALK